MNASALPSFLVTVLNTDRVLVRENNRVVTIVPAEEKCDCTTGLRGMLSAFPEMSVDRFLERKHIDKEFDL